MSSEDLSPAAMVILLDDVQLHVSVELFQRHLQKTSRAGLLAWLDPHGLDLLHHAILEGNLVVVGVLLTMGYFKPPHQPTSSWSYVHLAAVLGQRAIVSMLLQERPFDNRRVVLDWELFHEVIAPKLDVSKAAASIVPAEERERSLGFLPLDLAARYGHVRSVRTILDFHIFHSQQSPTDARRPSLAKTTGHMTMAVSLDSPFALRILLTDRPLTEDVNTALDVALKTAKAECMDALLRFGVDTKLLFAGMNLFHMLFAYGKSFQDSWLDSVVAVTSVLLRHGQDVNACRPSRTFPLYSLLRCTRMTSVETSTPFLMATLLLLLQAGADPNFDEVLVEEAVRDTEQNTAFGRRPYPSALHCVADAAHNYMEEVTDPEHVRKYVYKCCELLLHHGADPSYVGHYYQGAPHSEGVRRRGNALHAVCEVSPLLGRVNSCMLLLLLRHGADPDACIDDRYPLTAYLDTLPARSSSRGRPQQQQAAARRSDPSRERSPSPHASVATAPSPADDGTSDFVVDVRRMCRMVGFMSHAAQHHCATLLRSRLASSSSPSSSPPSSSLPDGSLGLKVALREVEKYTMSVPSLRRCCAIRVWCLCRRHAGNVYRLPIPTPLINTVMDYV